jgi:hypothetical protein
VLPGVVVYKPDSGLPTIQIGDGHGTLVSIVSRVNLVHEEIVDATGLA